MRRPLQYPAGSINRYYDPATGQFLTRDPVTAITKAPYSYASDDPLNESDALGLCSVLATLNPFSKNNCLRTAAEQGAPVSTAIEAFDPAYHAINGYYNEYQAAEHGCSGWTVAKYGAEGVMGTVGTVGVAGAGASAVDGLIGAGESAAVPEPPGYDPETWEIREASRGSNVVNSYWDPEGGEWRYHPADPWHDPHWDYNPWDQWNSPWRHR